jgi:transcriptional regulator with XRE-family HTH domain
MKSKKTFLLPSAQQILNEFGKNIKLARLRRKLSTSQIAERADISRATLWQIERGSPGVAIGKYLQALFVLGLEKDMLNVAKDDSLGRKLQDANILVKERAPKKPNKSK